MLKITLADVPSDLFACSNLLQRPANMRLVVFSINQVPTFDSCEDDPFMIQRIWVSVDIIHEYQDGDPKTKEHTIEFSGIPVHELPKIHLTSEARRKFKLVAEEEDEEWEGFFMAYVVGKLAKFKVIKDRHGECFLQMQLGRHVVIQPLPDWAVAEGY